MLTCCCKLHADVHTVILGLIYTWFFSSFWIHISLHICCLCSQLSLAVAIAVTLICSCWWKKVSSEKTCFQTGGSQITTLTEYVVTLWPQAPVYVIFFEFLDTYIAAYLLFIFSTLARCRYSLYIFSCMSCLSNVKYQNFLAQVCNIGIFIGKIP